MREIKFRAWYKESNTMDINPRASYEWQPIYDKLNDPLVVFMQYTGLKDKNGDTEIYECDIIDTDGNVIGNQHETPTLLEEKTNLLIQGFGTKDWLTTYKEAVERGCHDA